MEECELLDEFLGAYPSSFHPKDEDRFVRWAISAQKEKKDFPVERFSAILRQKDVEFYQEIYRWVGHFLRVLDEDS